MRTEHIIKSTKLLHEILLGNTSFSLAKCCQSQRIMVVIIILNRLHLNKTIIKAAKIIRRKLWKTKAITTKHTLMQNIEFVVFLEKQQGKNWKHFPIFPYCNSFHLERNDKQIEKTSKKIMKREREAAIEIESWSDCACAAPMRMFFGGYANCMDSSTTCIWHCLGANETHFMVLYICPCTENMYCFWSVNTSDNDTHRASTMEFHLLLSLSLSLSFSLHR